VKNRSGQVSIIFILLIPALLAALFSTANVSFAVRDRLRLQNAADAAALSAAEWQAKGMNQMAVSQACLESLALLKQLVESGREPAAKESARKQILEFEERRFRGVQNDARLRLPGYCETSGRQNGRLTLAGQNTSARGRDLGAEIFGIQGPWRFLSDRPSYEPMRHRVLSAAWRRPGKKGVLPNVFGRMDLGPGYAFASACAESEACRLTGRIVVPDFKAKIIRTALTVPAYRHVRENLGLYFISGPLERINREILH
jgi:hypothetical protein